jgi:Rad3-related DNA helicase
MLERARFNDTLFSLTNYPFFLTERIYVGALAVRNVMVLDECHTIEKQLLKFGEVELSDKLLREWDIRGVHVPEIDDKNDFADWLETNYLPKIEQQLADCAEMGKLADEEAADELLQRITALENQQRKVVECISGVRSKPDNWVYWCEQTEKDGNKAFCKPLDASPYMRILRSGATVRIYMSAFPGDKEPFCRSLGLEPDEVAWLRMKSSFPVENRPVVMGLVGSMSRKNQAQTLPAMMRVIDKILTKHHDEKGVIHCHSYELGEKIHGYIAGGSHRNRVLFPKKAEDRDVAVAQHYNPKNGPTVLISPSMTEGFDFKDDAARWQIIAKVPYPYLGDKQVLAKKDQSQEWYSMQAVMMLVQATGRVCRSEDDWGVTYILDSDFKQLWSSCGSMFPSWWKEAVVWV